MQAAVTNKIAPPHTISQLAAPSIQPEQQRQVGRHRRFASDRTRPVFHEKATQALRDSIATWPRLAFEDDDPVAATLQRVGGRKAGDPTPDDGNVNDHFRMSKLPEPQRIEAGQPHRNAV